MDSRFSENTGSAVNQGSIVQSGQTVGVRDFFNRRSAKVLLVMGLVLAVCIVAYSIWGHDWIRSSYEASARGEFSFINHARHDLDYYYQRVDYVFWQFIVMGIPLTLLFWGVFVTTTRRLVYEPTLVKLTEEPKTTFRYDSLIALGIYTIITLIYFWPLLGQFNSSIIGPPEDNMGGYWNLWFSNEMILRGNQSFTFTDYLYFPQGTSMYYFAWSFYNVGVSMILWLLMPPAAVFNFVILHSFPLAGLGAFLLIRKITGNSWIALIGGFIFAFSPNHFARSLHHGNLTSIQFIPFFVLYFLAAINEGGRKNLILASLFFLLNTLCDWNYMVIGGYLIVFTYLYYAIKRREWFMKDLFWKSVVVAGVSLILTLPWLWPMIKLGMTTNDVSAVGRNAFVIDLLGPIVPGVHHWLSNVPAISAINQSYTGNPWEAAGYLGIAAIGLVIITLRHTLKIAANWWAGFLVFLIMALGPQLHILGKFIPIALPYTVIAWIPFVSNVRAPARFMVFVYLFWAVLVSLSLLYLYRQKLSGYKRYIPTLILPALLFADFFSVAREITPVQVAAPIMALAADGDSYGVLNLPLGYSNSMQYMMEQTVHRIPMVDGSATRKIGQSLIDSLEFDDISLQREQLTAGRVKYIVLHLRDHKSRDLNMDRYLRVYRLVEADSSCLIFQVY